jgi:hypothetical protein
MAKSMGKKGTICGPNKNSSSSQSIQRMHRRPLQPLQPQHLLSNRSRLQKRKKILFLHLRWCLHNALSIPETTGWWNRFNPTKQQVHDNLPQTKQHNFSNKAHNSPRFRFNKRFPLFLGHSMQWIPFLPKGGGLIQVDIGGHPPVPNSNWLILTVFSSTCFSVMGTLLCNYGFCTSEAVLNPYTTSRWILVATHLVQLAYFGSFHLSTSFCTFGAILRP